MMRSSLPGEVMLRKYQTSIGSFTRKSTFFWASVGATVGLANLWQFPYLASIHGGGLFILLYLACLLIVTLPLMVTEAVIGRHARHGHVWASRWPCACGAHTCNGRIVGLDPATSSHIQQ